MATLTDNGRKGGLRPPEIAPATLDTETSTRLQAMEVELRKQGATMRSAQRAWGIFAFFALLIAMASLIAVATKLEGKSNSSAAAAPAAPVAPAATPAATPGKVAVSLKEFKVIPTAAQAPAGRVTFNVRNNGTVPHEMVVLRTDTGSGSLPVKGAKADETGNVGETGDLGPGAGKSVSLNLKPGHYAIICNLPGHYKAGQHTDFTVK